MSAGLDRMRRWGAGHLDKLAVNAWRRMSPGSPAAWDGDPRFALLSVNYSTTRWLKLMLISLAEQSDLFRLGAIVICDNGSRDGGPEFLRNLAASVSQVHLVENRLWTHHARGMRLAMASLRKWEVDQPESKRSNVFWHVDPDVILVDPALLGRLANAFADPGIAFAGELRRHVHPLPEAQASFLAVRRDWAERRDVSPWVHGGSPAWPLQRDIWCAGGTGRDLPVYREGMAIHRGRAGVAAAREFHPGSAYASATSRLPHFMGVAGAEARWQAYETNRAHWLEPQKEPELLDFLAGRFQRLS